MGHTLLHQILVSDLVVPIMFAEAPEHRSLTQFGVRLGEDTWLRPDLVVVRREQIHKDVPYVTGAPLLVVEVASEASRARDLAARRDLWARHGLTSYWVVNLVGENPEMRVYELAGESYLERARLSWGESYWVTEPFKFEVAPDQIFERLPRKLVEKWRVNVPKPPAPDLPPAGEKVLYDAFSSRWPTGAEKVELEDGCPVFYGVWDERDVEIAERTYPGRIVRLDQKPARPGTLRVLPAADDKGPVRARRRKPTALPEPEPDVITIGVPVE
ncbi:MAG TPA: Uma2 family endonuclease [Streptosporangiaceae bacterium]|nr:Uma2 family endonuclease [Streptosporangiaceae bacterium]